MRIFNNHAELDDALRKDSFRFLPAYGPAGFVCSYCGETKPLSTEKYTGGTGYAITRDQQLICYECAGNRDREEMIKTGKGTLYLNDSDTNLTNWPGTLKFRVTSSTTGKHNIARVIYHVTFTGPDGKPWYGKRYGDNTQLCHVRRYK